MNRPTCFRISQTTPKRLFLTLRTTLALLGLVATIPAHGQLFTDMYNFGTASGDPAVGNYPGIIAQGRDGNLYSTSPGGVTNTLGTVFKITPTGVLSVIYNFDNTHGAIPESGLTLGTDGNFYGTAQSGGTFNSGVIFKVTPAGNLTVLYEFTGTAPDGGHPYAAPIQGTDGNFYGTAFEGGSMGVGSVYKLTQSGKFTTLHSFKGTDGKYLPAPLVQGTDGNFYGTTEQGGSHTWGTVFRVTAAGNFKVLYNFDNTHGSYIIAPLIQGTDGNLYGTAGSGGPNTDGTVFQITPAGTLTVLHNFTGFDGYLPQAALVQASDGNFYGVTTGFGPTGYGAAFSITAQSNYSVVSSAFSPSNGEVPTVTLLQHTNGILYGDTFTGGTGTLCTCGTFYSLNPQLPPFAGLVSSSGGVGRTIGILGQGFTGTTGVSFSGTVATFKVVLDTYLTAQVPKGATTGSLTVTTPGGSLTSKQKFRVTPQIKAFTPPSGSVGTVVTITGVSLTQTSKVTFGGVSAPTFIVDSDTQVRATVPTGAKTGQIIITTPGGTAASAAIFTVTH